MTARIILLNGVGSSGKSSIAKAIQAQARGVFLHVQMDTWLQMMPARTFGSPEGLTFLFGEADGRPLIDVVTGPKQGLALRGMRRAIAAMAEEGCDMVVDDVIFSATDVDEYRALLKAHDLNVVAVHAPLGVLEAREKARGDRAIGLARGQFGVVHRGVTYDFEVDTSRASAEECARAILGRFKL
jgi:chloramphenicol 3-O phosphotransferase